MHCRRLARAPIIVLILLAGFLPALVGVESSFADPRPDPAVQPSAPIRAAFFYPWFPHAWKQQGIYPYSRYTPMAGYYDTTDDAVIDAQLRQARYAGIDAFISSWWGRDHHTDSALQHLIARTQRPGSPFPDLRWSVYYEEEGQGDPSPARIAGDLRYLEGTVFNQPGFLRVGGRPVVFVWAQAEDGPAMVRRWRRAEALFGGDIFVVLKVYRGYRDQAGQADSWHQYAPSAGYDEQLPYSVSVGPGFWKVDEGQRLPRDMRRFRAHVEAMAASGAFWHLVATWNEWGEGTGIEPTKEFGWRYLDVLCDAFTDGAACSGRGRLPVIQGILP